MAVTTVYPNAKLWQLCQMLPPNGEEDEAEGMPAPVEHAIGTRWNHQSNLAFLMLTYITEGCDHPFAKETYETTM